MRPFFSLFYYHESAWKDNLEVIISSLEKSLNLISHCSESKATTEVTDSSQSKETLCCLWAMIKKKKTQSAQTHLPEAFRGTSSVVYSHSAELIESDNEFTPSHQSSF